MALPISQTPMMKPCQRKSELSSHKPAGQLELFRDLTEKNNLTSGRFIHWENGLNAFFTSPLFGLGGQADRMHIDHNVSNMLIYILMCGGLIGLIFATLSIVKPLAFIWKLFKNKTENKNKNKITWRPALLLCYSVFYFSFGQGIIRKQLQLV